MQPPRSQGLILTLMVLLATCAATAPAVASAEDPATWTVLLYMDGDNDLEGEALVDLDEWTWVSSEGVSVVALLDRAEGHAESEEDWTEARLLELTSEGWLTLESWGEPNMGDPETLSSFLAWGLQSYPADRHAIVFWDHGSGWQGFTSDESHDGDSLTLEEIASGLAFGLDAAGLPGFDLIGFDGCFMATLEVAEAVAPYGRVMLASQELEPGEGWDYQAFHEAVARGLDAPELAASQVEAYVTYYRDVSPDPLTTLSALDLTRIPALLASLGALQATLEEADGATVLAFAEAAHGAPRFPLPDADARASVDLFDWMERAGGIDAPFAEAARRVAAHEASVVLAEGHNDGHPRARGLAFYGALDPEMRLQVTPDALGLPVASQALADAFDALAARIGGEDAEAPVLTDLEAEDEVVVPGISSLFRVLISDPNLRSVDLVLLTEDETGSLYVEQIEPIYPDDAIEDEDGTLWATWSPEEDLEIEWDATGYVLETDDDMVLAPFVESSPGSPYYDLYGSLTQASGRIVEEALLRFDVRTGDLISAWNLNPHGQIPIGKGDAFEIVWDGWDAEGEEISGVSDPLVIGPSGAWMSVADLATGEYLLAVQATDLAGNVEITPAIVVQVGDPAEARDEESPYEGEAPRAADPGEPLEAPLGPVALAALAAAALTRRRLR